MIDCKTCTYIYFKFWNENFKSLAFEARKSRTEEVRYGFEIQFFCCNFHSRFYQVCSLSKPPGVVLFCRKYLK